MKNSHGIDENPKWYWEIIFLNQQPNFNTNFSLPACIEYSFHQKAISYKAEDMVWKITKIR